MSLNRCAWAHREPSLTYHDTEWGVPLHDDRRLFEFLCLEGAQAGLSWETILKKRAHYRVVFDDFDAARIAHYGPAKVAALLADPGIVRNRLKVAAFIQNAQAYLRVQQEFQTFDAYLWNFVAGQPHRPAFTSTQEIPVKTPTAEALSRDLLKRGFKFVGPTICYAFMQATGMVNDHVVGCFRYHELGGS